MVRWQNVVPFRAVIQYFIDIDISQNLLINIDKNLINIDINIFQILLIDIDADIDNFNFSISILIFLDLPYQYRYWCWYFSNLLIYRLSTNQGEKHQNRLKTDKNDWILRPFCTIILSISLFLRNFLSISLFSEMSYWYRSILIFAAIVLSISIF